jgi:enoyl-CoA hydratase/carnithine racemase
MIEFAIANRVATVVLNRPPANAINLQWVARFQAILDDLDKRDDWNVLHIRSALRLFSSGADIKEMRAAFESADGPAPLIAAVRDYQRLFARIEALPQVTLAEIGGAAMGGGFELALSCDMRVVADEARIGLPEIRLGLLPGAGGTQRLTRLCGRAVAIRVIAGAEMVDGQTAVQLGMAQWHFPASQLEEAAVQIARRYADQPALAGRLAKGCIEAALDPTSAHGFDLEFEGSKTLLESAETGALIARFLAAKAGN